MSGENTLVYFEQGGNKLVVKNGGEIEIQSGGILSAGGTQASAITDLTDSTGGTANDTVAAVDDIALSTSDTYTDAAVNAAVNTALATVNDDLADLAAKINAMLAVLRGAGLMASS